MTEGDKVVLCVIVVIYIIVLLLFGTGAFHKFNDQWDKGRLEYEHGEKGDLVLMDGRKHWKPDRGKR